MELLFTYSTAALTLNKYSSCDQIKYDLGRKNNTHGRPKKYVYNILICEEHMYRWENDINMHTVMNYKGN
jgi:hypothetical protein